MTARVAAALAMGARGARPGVRAAGTGGQDASRAAAPAGREALVAPPRRSPWAAVSFAAVCLAIYGGWLLRSSRQLTPESGLGYALGIVGGAMMLLLLLYPLRKKARFMRALGPTKYWFRAHMILGVLGPLLVLYHANFSLGSLNSNVALVAMLTVAISGVVGRYFYARTHYGLYGRRADLAELRRLAADNDGRLNGALSFAPKARARLRRFEAAVRAPCPNLAVAAFRRLSMGPRTRLAHLLTRWELGRALRREARARGWSRAERRARAREARRFVAVYLATLRKAADLLFFERLLSLWHVVHLPLFFILILAASVHVVAVHMY